MHPDWTRWWRSHVVSGSVIVDQSPGKRQAGVLRSFGSLAGPRADRTAIVHDQEFSLVTRFKASGYSPFCRIQSTRLCNNINFSRRQKRGYDLVPSGIEDAGRGRSILGILTGSDRLLRGFSLCSCPFCASPCAFTVGSKRLLIGSFLPVFDKCALPLAGQSPRER